MARVGNTKADTAGETPAFGMLLGWSSDPAGERVALKLQSAQKLPDREEDVHEYRYFLTRDQAVQLGHYLYTITGETAPKRKRGWLDRWLGK